MRQAEMAQPATKGAGVGIDVDQAIRLAMGWKPGPVSLSMPQDLLEAEVAPAAPASVDPGGRTLRLSARGPIPSPLQKAHRPLILCGRLHPRGLEDELGIPVIPMESPRGVADPSLGAFAQILAKADCVLLVGKPLDFTLKFGNAFAPDCEILESDAFPGAERVHPASDWLSEVRSAISYRPPEWDRATASAPGTLHPVQMLRPLQAILDGHRHSVLVSDGGEIGQWAQACLSAPHRVINGAAGSIGSALPFALAARLAQPGAPVIAVMGDGTFGFHPAEIDTAVRYRLPFVLVVGNDARWNAEYQIQLRTYGRDRLVATELLPTRYDEVAKAFGGHGELVTEPAGMLPAARRAIASGLPAVLNVMIEGLAAPVIRR
jgi:acetolactate synthase-1/2/3 large subunit